MSHLWMDRPVKRESVSREGGEVSVERKEDSGSLWHRSHLHNSAGSRWTDWRINGQTERGRGETQKHAYSQALLQPPPAHTVPLQKGRRRRGCKKINTGQHQTVWCEKESGEIQPNRTAQNKLEIRQSVSQTRTGRQVLSCQRDEGIERQKPRVFTALLQMDQGDARLETVSNKNTTQNIVPCTEATCTVILCLQQNEG